MFFNTWKRLLPPLGRHVWAPSPILPRRRPTDLVASAHEDSAKLTSLGAWGLFPCGYRFDWYSPLLSFFFLSTVGSCVNSFANSSNG